jgi:hypothetical protein
VSDIIDAQRAAFIAAHHDPDAKQRRMVWSIWEDGEITLEKGAELFGQRSLHMIQPPAFAPWPVGLFPVKNYAGDHGRFFPKLSGDYGGDEVRALVEQMRALGLPTAA